MSLEAHVARLRGRNFDWPIPWETVETIARKEACRLRAYLCPAGVPTIGWGETEGVELGMVWTEDQVDSRLYQQVVRYARRVRELTSRWANPNQLGAMVSLAYNIGLQAFSRSSVLRLHNAGDHQGAARAFHLWNKARVNGQLTVLAGLTSRRAAEAALYLKPEDDEEPERLPQAVEPESKLVASPIAQSTGVAVAGGGTVAAAAVAPAVSESVAVVAAVREEAAKVQEFIGVPPLALVGAVLVVAGAWGMWWRYKQRAGGWA